MTVGRDGRHRDRGLSMPGLGIRSPFGIECRHWPRETSTCWAPRAAAGLVPLLRINRQLESAVWPAGVAAFPVIAA